MNDVKVGTFTASASAVNVPVGFIPDAVILIDRATPSMSIGVIGSGDNGLNIAAAAAAEAAAFAAWTGEDSLTDLTGTVAMTVDLSTVTGTSTLFTTELAVGESVVIEGIVYKIVSIASATSMVVDKAAPASISGKTAKRYEGRAEGFTVPAAATVNTTGTIDFIAFR